MMRVGIDGRYMHDRFPGIGRYVCHLIDALARVAPTVHFVVLHDSALGSSRCARLAQHPNVELIEIDAPPITLSEQWRVPLAIRRLRLDVFHAPYHVKPCWLPCPSVVSLHDVIPAIYPQALRSRSARLACELSIRLALRTARRIVTPSHASCRDLVCHYGVAANRVSVTYYGVAPTFRPTSPETTARIRERYMLPDQYVLYLGINKPHKNLVRLVDAFSLLTRRLSGLTLVIGGRWDSRYPEPLQRAAALGLGDAVRFLGAIPEEDLPALYSGATAFVFPSLYEGFGLPVLEALACGVPVICSGNSSLPEVTGDAAVLVDPRDVDSLAAAMRRVLQDAALRDELRGKALARAREFTWQRTALATLAVYRDV